MNISHLCGNPSHEEYIKDGINLGKHDPNSCRFRIVDETTNLQWFTSLEGLSDAVDSIKQAYVQLNKGEDDE